MKKAILAGVACLSMFGGAVLADQVHDWHDLEEVHKHVKESLNEMERAQKANAYDMGGHAAKAEELLRNAERELHEAVEARKNSR